jgi:hypothetical protein
LGLGLGGGSVGGRHARRNVEVLCIRDGEGKIRVIRPPMGKVTFEQV